MELNELTEKLTNMIAEKEQLEKERNQCNNTLAKKIAENYETLFVPQVKPLQELDNKLSDACNLNLRTESEYDFDYSYKGFMTHCYNFEILSSSSMANSNRVLYFGKFFLSEDLTIKTIEEAKKIFLQRFTEYEKRLTGINDYIRECVKELKAKLEQSSAVEQKEDGSVEFHINGKTYIGTVKEQ